jgi:hypothetical protein
MTKFKDLEPGKRFALAETAVGDFVKFEDGNGYWEDNEFVELNAYDHDSKRCVFIEPETDVIGEDNGR